MSKLIAGFTVVGMLMVFGTLAEAGHGCCPCSPCQCTPSATAQSVPQSAVPPAAPSVGQTQQSQSVQPQAAPPVAPRSGVTTRNYSYQPAPVQTYRAAPRSRGRQPYSPEQRLHPSNRLMGP